jgi:DNA-binding MarR family transcriptional regulator
LLKAIIVNSNGMIMGKHLFEYIFSIKRKCLSTEEKICKGLQISFSEFNGLIALQPQEEILGIMFAERLGLSPSRGSRVLTKLINHGYAQIRYNPDDRRSVSISMTQKGLLMKKEIENRLDQCEERVMSVFSKEQIEEIKQTLSKLDQAL